MADKYDFKYLPLTGELPGKEFERQTEQAINEVGEAAHEAKETAQEAAQSSAQAEQVAAQALENAQSALTAAGNAQQGTDENAQSIQTLQENANINKQDIEALQGGMAQAEQNITASAGNIAQNSESIANMQGSVAEAASAAASAYALGSSIANLAKGVFIVDAAFRDANELYGAGEKLYLTNAGEALNDDGEPSANLNFPPQLSPPLWFEMFISEGGANATQTAWDSSSAHIFTRVGAINASDPENPVATWTPWNSVAVPQTVKNVEVEDGPEGQPAGTYLVITFDTEAGDLPVYVNLTQLLPAYAAGNGAIEISSDYKVSLKLAENGGLEINEGLKLSLAQSTGQSETAAMSQKAVTAALAEMELTPGADGATGPPGAAATVAVGTTSTGAAGTNAAVSNSGTSSAAVLNFVIPRGQDGATGPQGAQGIQGVKGDKGDKGDTGNAGPAGVAGPQGPAGANGTSYTGPEIAVYSTQSDALSASQAATTKLCFFPGP
jgi:hypothetical protein